MPKRDQNTNAVYISERMRDSLRPISRHTLTAVVAPMGYGKTTAVNWYLGECAKSEKARIVRISVYSDNLAIFWKSVQDAFTRAGYGFLGDYPCPYDAVGGSMLSDDLCHELFGDPCFVFIDDFHLLTDARAAAFICNLANRLPQNVHLIIASRDKFLPAAEALRLGRKVYTLGIEQLRLSHTELSVYAQKCGAALSDEQLDTLLYSSEGWFSAVYLNLRTLAERGSFPDRNSDVYAMFTAALIDPLPPKMKEFLAVMGLADEFTAEEARIVTGMEEAERIIVALTEQNAFVTRLPDGVTYRFHHMMKECAERTFLTLAPEARTRYINRFGSWYKEHGMYLHAIAAYGQSENYSALLSVIEQDAGILLAALKPSDVLAILDRCPTPVLKEHPTAILVLMRRMFTWGQIPKMMELKALLLTSVEEHPDMSAEERGNLVGECDLIMSFLMYNDISEMSRLHRRASAQMSRPAISIRCSGGWTFGSPSVLMMFHREPGGLEAELADMDECMPHYYKITNGHGRGAERIMRAEALFMQGHLADAKIKLECAYAQIDGNGQENMTLCCDFLAWRLALCTDHAPRYGFEERRTELLHQHNTEWLNILSAADAYCHAVSGETDKIPPLFAEHRLSSVNFLAPGKPMMEMIENQVYLSQGEYAKVIGRSEGILDVCSWLHYGLVALHVRIQAAAAYEMLGKRAEAEAQLELALLCAEADGFIASFAENYRYLKPILGRAAASHKELVRRITELCREYESRLKQPDESLGCTDALAALSPREREITELISKRLTNREIAEKLFLSEGSVKQYTNQIYSKLHIDGDTRTKRRRLIEIANS